MVTGQKAHHLMHLWQIIGDGGSNVDLHGLLLWGCPQGREKPPRGRFWV